MQGIPSNEGTLFFIYIKIPGHIFHPTTQMCKEDKLFLSLPPRPGWHSWTEHAARPRHTRQRDVWLIPLPTVSEPPPTSCIFFFSFNSFTFTKCLGGPGIHRQLAGPPSWLSMTLHGITHHTSSVCVCISPHAPGNRAGTAGVCIHSAGYRVGPQEMCWPNVRMKHHQTKNLCLAG